jgi:hypothetical protein
MPIPYGAVHKPFVGPMDESVEPALLEDGFTLVSNGSYEEQGKIRKRPGTVSQNTAPAGTWDFERIIKWKDELLLATGKEQGFVLRPRTVTSLLGITSQMSEPTVRRTAIERSIQQDVFNPEVAVCNDYVVYVWQAGTSIYYRVADLNGRTVIFTTEIGTSRTNPRVAVSGDQVTFPYVLIIYTATGGGGVNMYGRIVTCTPLPTISSEITLVANADNGTLGSYDITPNTTVGNFLLGYITSANNLEGYVITSTSGVPALGFNFHPGAAGVGTISRVAVLRADPTGVEAGILAYHDTGVTGVRYKINRVNNASAYLAATTILGVPTAESGLSITKISENSYVFVASGTDFVMRWRWGTDTGTLGTERVTMRLRPEGKAFTQNSLQYVYCNIDDGFALVELNDSAASARLVAGFGRSIRAQTNQRFMPSWMSLWEDGVDFRWHTGVYTLAHGVGSHKSGDHLTFDFTDDNRYQSAESGDLAYWGGGLIQYTDGEYVHESGFIQRPILSAADGAGTGLVAGDVFQYILVYEWFDRWGNYHQSEPGTNTDGLVVQHTVPNNGAGQGTIDVTLRHCTLSLRQRQTATQHRIQHALYRADISAGAAASVFGVFFREFTVSATPATRDNDPLATTSLVVNDNGANFSTANPTLYTTGGVLEQDSVFGGGTAFVRHKNRLWSAGGEEPDIIWYSQEETEQRPAEWNIAQQVRAPGEVINSLASLDDALVAFSEDRIYAIVGEGPNSTGDPQSGSFSAPILIHSDGGCAQPRGTVSTPLGVFYVGAQGFYLLDRSRSSQYIGDPVQDTFAAFPRVRAAVYVPHRGEVRWLCQDTNQSSWRVIVFDFEAKKWSVWTHSQAALGVDATYSDGAWYYLTKTGVVRKESATVFTDDGTWYGVGIITGHMAFGDWQTYKRVRRIRPIIEKRGTGGMTVEMIRNGHAFGTANQGQTFTWTEAEVAALSENGMRAHVHYQKGHRYQFRFLETQPASPDEGLAFIGCSFEVGIRGGVQRAPKADSK